jgi:hypothetical protein
MNDGELLQRHRPLLRYDAQEPYRAVSAATITDNPGNLLAREDGSVIARAGAEGGPVLSLDTLVRYPDGLSPVDGDRLDETGDVLAAARRMQEDPRYADRVYGRVVPDGDTTWLQYWLWLYYNPKHLLGFGKHEGDWELVQVGIDSGGRPALVTYAQHVAGEARSWEEIEHHRSDSGEHPVVYVAPFSHASYFESGTHFYPVGTDNPDGAGPALLPEVEDFGEWSGWVGRWGNSEGVLADLSRGRLGGRSPASPGRQGKKWTRPGRFHQAARRRRPRARLGRLLWTLGKATYPGRPEVSARLEDAHLRVDYRVPRTVLRRPRQLYLTVHDPESQEVLASHAVPVEEMEGSVDLMLPERPPRVLVRASAFNRARQRSDLSETTAAQS